MRLHHIGIIVKNINEAAIYYKNKGFSYDGLIIKDEIQYNRIVFMEKNKVRIELIEPIDPRSTVWKASIGVHHICYDSEGGKEVIHMFKAAKVGKIFTRPIYAPALEGKEIVFACLKNGLLVEFIL